MAHSTEFRELFAALTDFPPFPWQEALYQRFLHEDFPDTCLLPTGLGKTAIVVLWMIGLAERPDAIPRRLVYIVNRRTVVDQTTNEVERIRNRLARPSDFANDPRHVSLLESLQNKLAGLCALSADVPLAISTLRGRFADNREWSKDPARPAVVCGTVDMIGSRLLFSGYRTGFKSRPLHAGLLGQDVLLIHDEAHLEPAFQQLLESLRAEQRKGREFQRFHVIQLSATARGNSETFELTPEDARNETVRRRIEAKKHLYLHAVADPKALAPQLLELALAHRDSGRAILVFARKVETVEKVAEGIKKELKKAGMRDNVKVLTGTMRGYERDALVATPVFRRFLPGLDNKGADNAGGTVFLVCTSAGEVGINLTADHLVCDLSTFESMVQRFGRVNRFGERDDTRVDVVYEADLAGQREAPGDSGDSLDFRRSRTLPLLEQLSGDASSAAIARLDPAQRQGAFAPEPETIPLTDILFDALALTTITAALPGRPALEALLHGIAEWDPPETEVAWREEVERLPLTLLEQLGTTPDELLEEYPLKPHELLRDRSDRIYDRLKKLENRWNGPVWIVDQLGNTHVTGLSELVEGPKDDFRPRTVLLPPSAGGLSEGILAPSWAKPAEDVADRWNSNEGMPRRMRIWDNEPAPPGMRLIRTLDTRPEAEELDFGGGESPSNDEPPQRRLWHWYARPFSADDDGSNTAARPIPLDAHLEDVTDRMRRIAERLLSGLPELQKAFVIAAQLHDSGKRRLVWQRSIGNPHPSEWYAKSGVDGRTGGRWRPVALTRYRHEFGSLLDAIQGGELHLTGFEELPGEEQELVLHLIASHHGYARPHFPDELAFDPNWPERVCREVARTIPCRFARLQRRFGRWGLAYLESLLRAADWSASAEPSAAKEGHK